MAWRYHWVMPVPVHEIPSLRDRSPVFRDRTHAGQVLAEMLEGLHGSGAIVLAIPAGGVPVAAEIARCLGFPLDVAIVSKILLPWTTEAGFGAVAFDGTVWIDEDAVRRHRLKRDEVEGCAGEARAKVERRVRALRGDRPFPALAGRTAILIDDGIAAGSTLRTAIAALRGLGASDIVVAVPTGHSESVQRIAALADTVYCANVRSGYPYAVAHAYEAWQDVDEGVVANLLRTARDEESEPPLDVHPDRALP
jgi:putative phosphoribosyl transferase